ncbi:site-specific integrase [Gammaproteobacteria bacterium LSUCC0112]|nr:site-specific integrase [Gammaproteobacteria bacterium LSUCC0112]
MPTVQLTDISIRHLKPSEAQVTYYDASLHGFGVRVSPGGTMTYTLVYGANRKRVTLGRVGILTLAEARKEAKRVLAEHTLGKTRPKNMSFETAQEMFLEESEARNKKRTTDDYKRFLTSYFKYGRTPLIEITKEDIKKRLAKLKDRPCEQHHAFVILRRLLRWAVNNQYLPHNPMDGLKAPPQNQRKHVLAPQELKTALRTALEYKCTFGYIFVLLTLTGQRRTEIASLQWDWIHGDTITLPSEVTKNGLEHTFPICGLAQKVIAEIPRTHEQYVFPAGKSHRRGKPTTIFNSWSKSKALFDAKLEKVGPYTLHDLRRTLSTNFAELGIPIAVTEKLLNHVSGTHGGVQGTYNRYTYMKEMREAVEKYEAFLLS